MIIVAFVLMTAVIGLAAYFLQGQLELPGRETGSRGDAAQEDSQEELEFTDQLDPKGDGEESGGGTEEPGSGTEESGGEPEESGGQGSSAASSATIVYNRPSQLRGARLVAGEDFLVSGTDRATVEAEAQAAVETAAQWGINTLMIDCFYDNKALHLTSTMPSVADYDILQVLVEAAKSQGMFVYGIYDLSLVSQGSEVRRISVVNTENINRSLASLEEFAKTCGDLDGVIFTGYYNSPSSQAYADYMESGGGEGYANYLQDNSYGLVAQASRLMRRTAPAVEVGLYISHPWANASENEEGSQTQAEFTALVDGGADTRAFLRDKLATFVLVENYNSLVTSQAAFDGLASWWIAEGMEEGYPVYMELASSKACTDEAGWTSPDQLARQLFRLDDLGGVDGCSFDSLSALAANPETSTDLVVGYYNETVSESHILRDLVFTNPSSYQFTTFERELYITGASDPNFDVLMDGEKIETDQNGFFAVTVPLEPGQNIINFSHKDRERQFVIQREVQIIQSVSPTGSMAVDGGTEVTVDVVAYQDAQVSGTIGGQSFTLTVNETVEDEELRGTSYKHFTGTFVTPSATDSVQNMGSIQIYAAWEGLSDSRQGASVTVNKRVAVGDGVLVRVTSEFAETFPTARLNNISDPDYFPLPKGTMDYAVGDEVVYREGSNVYRYYNLACGLRVYSDDIQGVSGGDLYENSITGIQVEADGREDGYRYTRVVLNCQQNVPYIVRYSGSSISFDFQYTTTVPSDLELTKNPLFSSATWSGSTLTLKLRKSGAFLGYKAEYGDGGLILTFNNPTSIENARVVVDPGHGVKDKGASGFNPNYPEAVVNWEVAEYLAEALEDMGATVRLIQTQGVSTEPTMAERLATARAFAPHVYISVHSNSASSAASGSEAYYFYPFARNLATYASAEAASALNTDNRGGKYGLYYVTRESQFVSVLTEMGFLSSQSEYNKLIDSKYQKRVANGLADAVATFLDVAGASNAGLSGTESTGRTSEVTSSGSSGSSGGGELEDIYLEPDRLSLEVGDRETLDVVLEPDDVEDDEVEWESSDEDVATVNSSGRVTAVGEGTATITVTHAASGLSADCRVTVGGSSGGEVEEIELDETSLSLSAGESYRLTADVYPGDADDSSLEWSSSDTSVATVNSSGRVTAVGAGTATVTASCGGAQADCRVTVTGSSGGGNRDVMVEELTLDVESLTMGAGDTIRLTATAAPSDAYDTGVVWRSSDTSVATVDSDGKVTAVGAGTCRITAMARDGGGAQAVCTLEVAGSGGDDASDFEDSVS